MAVSDDVRDSLSAAATCCTNLCGNGGMYEAGIADADALGEEGLRRVFEDIKPTRGIRELTATEGERR
jgi:hypothetical protein